MQKKEVNSDGLKQQTSYKSEEKYQNKENYSEEKVYDKAEEEPEDDTEFSIAYDPKEEGYIIVYGRMQVSKKVFENVEEAKKYLKLKPWDILITLMAGMAEWVVSVNEANKAKRKKEVG